MKMKNWVTQLQEKENTTTSSGMAVAFSLSVTYSLNVPTRSLLRIRRFNKAKRKYILHTIKKKKKKKQFCNISVF